MDDIDSFLASLDQLSAPSISSGISAYTSRQHGQRQRAAEDGVQVVSDSEANQRGAPSGRRHKRERPGQPDGTGNSSKASSTDFDSTSAAAAAAAAALGNTAANGGVPSTALPSLQNNMSATHHRHRRARGGEERGGEHVRQPAREWSCPRCTLVNATGTAVCDACLLPRPAEVIVAVAVASSPPSSSLSLPPALQEQQQRPVGVACLACTLVNVAGKRHCAACRTRLPSSPTLVSAAVEEMDVHGRPPQRQRRELATTATATAATRTNTSEGTAAAHEHKSSNSSSNELDHRSSSSSIDDSVASSEDEYMDDIDATCSSDDSDDVHDDSSRQNTTKNDADPMDNRELVKFLQTLEAVPYDKLPCALIPPTMRVKGQLKPFQLQALHWLQSQEAGTSALPEEEEAPNDRTRAAANHRWPVEVDVDSGNYTRNAQDKDGDEEDEDFGRLPWHRSTASAVGFHVNDDNHSRFDRFFHGPAGNFLNNSSSSSNKEALKSVRGGIFADYMGLGKTRTMIALCESTSAVRARQLQEAAASAAPSLAGTQAQRRAAAAKTRQQQQATRGMERVTGSQVVSGATLIVCPTSLLRQWAAEIRKCVDSSNDSKPVSSSTANKNSLGATNSNRASSPNAAISAVRVGASAGWQPSLPRLPSLSSFPSLPAYVSGPARLATAAASSLSPTTSSPLPPPPRILIYHGAHRKRLSMFEMAENYDYVLTSYQILRHENMPKQRRGTGLSPVRGPSSSSSAPSSSSMPEGHHNFFSPSFNSNNVNGEGQVNHDFNVSATMQAAAPGKLFMVDWKRVILDEGHVIRNLRAKQSRACLNLTSRFKWVVTATPVHNSLNDLFPLLRFLDVPHFGNMQWWNEEIVRFFNADPQHPRPVTALRMLFSALMLRRTPDSVVAGEKILHLPPKEVRTEYVRLSRKEAQFYNAVHSSAVHKLGVASAIQANQPQQRQQQQQQQQQQIQPAAARLTTFSTAFEMLMRCRQTCLHPYMVVAALRRYHGQGNQAGAGTAPASTASTTTLNATAAAAASLKADWEVEQQRKLDKALDEYVDRVMRRAITVGKGTAFLQELVDELRKQKLEERQCIICLDTLMRPAILPCAHTFCEDCIQHALQMKRRCPMCMRTTHPTKVIVVPEQFLRGDASSFSDQQQHHQPQGQHGQLSPNSREEEEDVVASVASVDVGNMDNWSVELSAKTRFLLAALRGTPAAEQVVVFSSFTSYLTYAKHCLDKEGITNELYTGSLSLAQKDNVIRRFTGDLPPVGSKAVTSTTAGAATSPAPSAAVATAVRPPTRPPRVLLASTAACGVGLNLVCANHCFLMDPMWNPGAEDQALNRIHRIGQTRPVSVVKLIARETVEEKIELLNARKRSLNGLCFGGAGAGGAGGAGGTGKLKVEELMALFVDPESDDEEDEEEDSSDEEDA